jgi:hypothetical protein
MTGNQQFFQLPIPWHTCLYGTPPDPVNGGAEAKSEAFRRSGLITVFSSLFPFTYLFFFSFKDD